MGDAGDGPACAHGKARAAGEEEQRDGDAPAHAPALAGVDDGHEQEKKQQELKEDEIPFKAAKQVFSESMKKPKKYDKRKDVNSIEEAIKKAIEEGKKVIIMDN